MLAGVLVLSCWIISLVCFPDIEVLPWVGTWLEPNCQYARTAGLPQLELQFHQKHIAGYATIFLQSHLRLYQPSRSFMRITSTDTFPGYR